MLANGVISKVLKDKIEFVYSARDESEENCGNSFDKFKVKFGSGPAPLDMIRVNAPLFVEIKNRRIKDIYIIKDSKVDVYYGKIVKRIDRDNYLIQHSLNFSVPISKLTAKGKQIMHENIQAFVNSWIRIYTTSDLSILEAQFIEEFESLTVVLENFNINSQNQEETEIVHFKDSHSFSHYIYKNNVFFYNEAITIAPSIIKQLIGAKSEILLRNNELIAFVHANSSHFGITQLNKIESKSENHSSIKSSNHDESKNTSDVSIEESLKNEGNQIKYLYESQRNSVLQYYTTNSINGQESINLPEQGKSIYDSRIKIKIGKIEENLWSNSKFDQISNNFTLLVGILEVFCRKIEYNKICPLINQLYDYVDQNSELRDYLQIIEFLKNLHSISDISLRFYYFYEVIFTNHIFFELFANGILSNHNFDFFHISQTYKFNLIVYEKVDEIIIKQNYDFINEVDGQSIKTDHCLCFYTDYKKINLVYSADQMLEDNYKAIPIEAPISSAQLQDLLDQSLSQILTLTPIQVQLSHLHTYIETLKHLSPPLTSSIQKSLLTKAYSQRFHHLHNYLN